MSNLSVSINFLTNSACRCGLPIVEITALEEVKLLDKDAKDFFTDSDVLDVITDALGPGSARHYTKGEFTWISELSRRILLTLMDTLVDRSRNEVQDIGKHRWAEILWKLVDSYGFRDRDSNGHDWRDRPEVSQDLEENIVRWTATACAGSDGIVDELEEL